MASVRKRQWKTSKSELRTAWLVDFVDAGGQRDRQQFETKREADAYRIEIEGQLRGGTYRADARKVTVEELAALFLVHCEERMHRRERMTRHHVAGLRAHFKNHILHPERGIGPLKIAQLSSRAMHEFRDRLRSAGVSVVTTRKVIGTVHVMLSFGISRDLAAVNAAAGVRVIGRRDEGARKIIPPSKEALRALVVGADPDFRVKLVFAAATGLRASEFHALRWRHVELEKGEVTIQTRVDAYGDEDVAKTAAGMRTIPIAGPVARALREWKLRSRFSRHDDLVFPSRRGGYEDHGNMVKRRLNPTIAKAGVAKIGWHSLRHFAISCWIEQGLSPKTVQTFAGHSSLQVTMDRYGHLFPSDDHQAAMDRIAATLFEQNIT